VTTSAFAVGGHDEREPTLNQINTEVDGFSGSEGVVVLRFASQRLGFPSPRHREDRRCAYPCGPSGRTAATLPSMSVDEAEELVRQLVAVVTDARKGRFSEHGVQIAEDMRAQAVLGIEDLNNRE
jgi:hypothetical protein